MIWFNWSWRAKLALVAAMVGVSAGLTFLLAWSAHEPFDWRVVAGGIGFFTMPQLMGWMLFVAAKTGTIEMKGRFSRADQPFDFWFRVVGCCIILATYAYAAVAIATG
jgi:hypothetical protein